MSSCIFGKYQKKNQQIPKLWEKYIEIRMQIWSQFRTLLSVNCLTAASSGEGKYPGFTYANYVPFLERGGRSKDEPSGEVEAFAALYFF